MEFKDNITRIAQEVAVIITAVGAFGVWTIIDDLKEPIQKPYDKPTGEKNLNPKQACLVKRSFLVGAVCGIGITSIVWFF